MIDFVITRLDLKSIINTLSPIAKSTPDAESALSYIQFNIKGNRLTAVTCNGYMLSIKRCTINNNGDDGCFLVPNGLKINAKVSDYISITYDGKTITIYLGNETLTLLAGESDKFLDWRKCLSKKLDERVKTMDSNLLTMALKTCTDSKAPTVIHFSENILDPVIIG